MAISDKKQHWLDVIFRDKVELPGNEGVVVPSGTTAERPGSPDNGLIRYNITDARLEAYENSAWGPIGAGGGGGASNFIDLLDTFAAYTGRANHLLQVNPGETGVVSVDGSTLFIPLTGGGPVTGNVSFTGGATVTGLPITPLAASDAASKAYVDSISAGLDPKQSVRAATTVVGGNLPSYAPAGGTAGNGAFTSVNLTGPLTDSVSMNPGDRVLVKNQTLAEQNGIYVVLTGGPGGSMERAPDHDGSPPNEVSGGNYTFVEAGSQSGTGWVILFDGNIIINTHPINWTQFSGAGSASLASLTDTVITAPALNHLLQYDGANWINVPNLPRIQNTPNTVYVDTDLVSGQLDLKAADNAAGAGGPINITAGDATVSGNGGAITILTGIGTSGDSGDLTLRGANAATVGVGGDVSVIGGNAAGDRRGGGISLQAGSTTGTSVPGGDVNVTAGNSTGDGTGGGITLTGGVGTSGINEGGSIAVTPGFGPVRGSLRLMPVSGTEASEFRMYEGTANGTEYIGLKAPDAIAAPIVWTMPGADGAPLQFLQTNGAGQLQWATVSFATPSAIQDTDADTFVSTDFGGGDSDNLRLQTGSTDPTGNGGNMDLITGDGGSTSGNGGSISIQTGDAPVSGSGSGGNIIVVTGDGRQTGNSGLMSISTGAGGDGGAITPAGAAGSISLFTGSGGSSSFGNAGNGGTIDIDAGNGGNAPAGPGNAGNGGNVEIDAGDGGTSAGGTHGAGGSVNINAGAAGGNLSGGALDLDAGNGGPLSGGGGVVAINSGAAGGGNAAGGDITITCGSSAGNYDGANITVTAGSATGSADSKGGDITLTAGDGVATNGVGGKIILDPGAGQGSGTHGHVLVMEDGGGTDGGEIRLGEGNGGGDYVGFKAPTALAGSQTWELPNSDGSSNQVLTTDGLGKLTFLSMPYDVGSSIIGAPIPAGVVWRFSVPRTFLLNPTGTVSTAYCDAGSTATISTAFELHLVADISVPPLTGPAVIPGLGSPTCVGSIVFGPGAQLGTISTWPPGGGPLPFPGLPFPIPATHELVLLYPAPDATLGDVSFTFEGII